MALNNISYNSRCILTWILLIIIICAQFGSPNYIWSYYHVLLWVNLNSDVGDPHYNVMRGSLSIFPHLSFIRLKLRYKSVHLRKKIQELHRICFGSSAFVCISGGLPNRKWLYFEKIWNVPCKPSTNIIIRLHSNLIWRNTGKNTRLLKKQRDRKPKRITPGNTPKCLLITAGQMLLADLNEKNQNLMSITNEIRSKPTHA